MRICIIGNSHVGALKRAWDNVSDTSIEIDFFAARGARLKDLAVKKTILVPTNRSLKKALKFTSGGTSFIDPDKYDYFLIYGAQAKRFLFNLENNYSQAVIKESAKDHVKDTVSFDILTKLRNTTEKYIFLGHHPLPAAEEPIAKKVSEAYIVGIKELNRHVYNKLNCEMLPQPVETIVNGNFTDPIYSKGSKRLSVGNKRDDEPHPEKDKTHMNEKFGKIWLENFFQTVRGVPKQQLESHGAGAKGGGGA